MALNDDPHVMLPVDLRKMVKGKSFKVQISFTLLTESEVAARLVQQEEELKQALETTSDQNLKEHSALEAIEAANLAEQENHRLALANIELENLSAQERHRPGTDGAGNGKCDASGKPQPGTDRTGNRQ